MGVVHTFAFRSVRAQAACGFKTGYNLFMAGAGTQYIW